MNRVADGLSLAVQLLLQQAAPAQMRPVPELAIVTKNRDTHCSESRRITGTADLS